MKKKRKNSAGKVIADCLSGLYSNCGGNHVVCFSLIISFGLLLLDYYNIPLQYLNRIPCELPSLGIVIVFLIYFLWTMEGSMLDLFKIAAENSVDTSMFAASLISVLYTVVRAKLIGEFLYTKISMAGAVLAIAILLARLVIRCIIRIKAEAQKCNLTDLKSIYENRLTEVMGGPILVSEKDVDYDLLDRESIVKKLYTSIIHSQSEQSYVISLEGEWGSGKTTILNRTKEYLLDPENNEKKYVVIDDFDPWLYGTQEALLLGMFETIIRSAGLQYSPSRSKALVKELGRTVAEQNVAGSVFYNLIYNTQTHGENAAKIKKKLENYLRTQNKMVVFFIDNLDRANNENVVFLFKLIGIVFDLPGIVYVLSFERARINTILRNTTEIDPRFTEKIIQQEIKVPMISGERAKHLYTTCVQNLLSAYGVPKSEMTEYKGIIQYILSAAKDIRTFKRMINSVFAVVFTDDTILFKRDLLALELIHFFDTELYSEIYRNPLFFVSHGKDTSNHLWFTLHKTQFNANAKMFYENLFRDRQAAKNLMAEIFPYVRRYTGNQDLEPEFPYIDPDAEEIARQSRVCNGKYFELYFSYTANNALRIQKSVQRYVLDMNSAKTIQEAIKKSTHTLMDMNPEDKKAWADHLQSYICELPHKAALFTAISLYELIHRLDDNALPLQFALGARTRAEYIISELLTKCDEAQLDEFLERFNQDYQKLDVMRNILDYLENEKRNDVTERKVLAEKVRGHYKKMCEDILQNKRNLYSDNYYYKGNIWGLYRYFKDTERTESFIAYIETVIMPDHVYRVLWDTVRAYVSSTYVYNLCKEDFVVLGLSEEKVDGFIAQHPPGTSAEETVFEIYNAYKNDMEKTGERSGVERTTPILRCDIEL